MGRVRRKSPSPAMVVAIIALVFALAGSAVATVATVSVLNKKEKKQTRKIARDEIKKAAPGLSVANANIANTVQNGSIGTGQLAASIPAVRVTRTTDQSIANNAGTPLAFDSERYDTAAMHDNATNNSRLTAPVAGIYAVTVEIDWLFNATGIRNLELRRNGATPIATQTVSPPPTGDQEVTTQVRLGAGEFVEASVQQNSGGSLSVSKANEYSPEFSMTWLAPGP